MTKTTKKVLTVGCLLISCACPLSILLPVYKSARIMSTKTACFSNVRSLALANLQYAELFDQRLPSANGWMEKVAPYIKSGRGLETFHCPSLDRDLYGYAMNSKVADKTLTKFQHPQDTFLVFETAILGPNVSGDPTTVLVFPRHLWPIVSYVDGHTRDLRNGNSPRQ